MCVYTTCIVWAGGGGGGVCGIVGGAGDSEAGLDEGLSPAKVAFFSPTPPYQQKQKAKENINYSLQID